MLIFLWHFQFTFPYSYKYCPDIPTIGMQKFINIWNTNKYAKGHLLFTLERLQIEEVKYE